MSCIAPALSYSLEQAGDNSEYNQYVDLGGNPFDERAHNPIGWGDVQVPPANPITSPSGDNTKQYMVLRGDSSLDFDIRETGVPYTLEFEVEDGNCDDSFWILINGMEIFYYSSQHKGTVINHKLEIPAEFVKDYTLKVTFRNAASDNCGLAAFYNVRLIKGGIKESRAPLDGEATLTPLGEFSVTAYNVANENDYPCEDSEKILTKGLNNYYCSEFLEDVMYGQGTGLDNNGRYIKQDESKGTLRDSSDNYFKYVNGVIGKYRNVEDGVSVAFDPSTGIVEPGDWIYVENYGWKRADDTGSGIKGKELDIFMIAPRPEVLAFGVKKLDVWRLQPSELIPKNWRPIPEAAMPVSNPQTSLVVPSESVQSPISDIDSIPPIETPANNDAVAWNERGVTLYSQGKYDEALECFNEATRIDPKYAKAWDNKATALLALDRCDEFKAADEMAGSLGLINFRNPLTYIKCG